MLMLALGLPSTCTNHGVLQGVPVTNWDSRASPFAAHPLQRGIFPSQEKLSLSLNLEKMSSPLDSQSDRIFTDDESEVGSCTGSSPKQRNGTCSTPCQIGKTPKRRRILPTMLDSSGAEESDAENSQTQVGLFLSSQNFERMQIQHTFVPYRFILIIKKSNLKIINL